MTAFLRQPETLGDCPVGPTDWYYRTYVPKDPRQHVRFRKQLLKLAFHSPKYANELWIICARDLLFYLNAFGWLMEPRKEAAGKWYTQQRPWGSEPVVPFLTRKYQDDVLLEMWEAWGRKDIVMEKSREMGASWMFLYMLDHSWRFESNFHAGVASKDEATVDAPGSPDSLFYKLDWIEESLPWFLRVGPANRIRLVDAHTIQNKLNGSSIQGYAATGNIATGGRKAVMILDEMHKWREAAEYDALNSVQHVGPCRVFISTPSKSRGPSGAFYDLVMAQRDSMVKLRVPWWRDPEKTRGAYRAYGDRVDILDRSYHFPVDYPFVGDGKLRSTYYDYECGRALSPQDVAAELDMDFGGSSTKLFDRAVLSRAKAHVSEPQAKLTMARDEDGFFVGIRHGQPTLVEDDIGQIHLWFKPIHENGQLVIPASDYVIGCDVSQGVDGEYSSQSAIVIIDMRTKTQVGLWADGATDPSQMADLVWCLGTLFANESGRPALVCPEVNGPGSQFARRFLSRGYSHPYFRRTTDRALEFRDRTTKSFGLWTDDRGTKILTAVQEGLRRHGLKIRSGRIIKELERYQLSPDGKATHPSASRKTGSSHGDCGIAIGCAWWPYRNQSDADEEPEEPEQPILPGCAAYRRLQHLRETAAAQDKPWWSRVR